MIYKVTKPKIIFCDVENYNIAERVNRELNLGGEIFVINDNDSIKGVRHITDLLKLDNSHEDATFRYDKFLCGIIFDNFMSCLKVDLLVV